MPDSTFNWDWPTPFTLDVTVQEEDIDGLNHTNNTVYVKWCEAAGWQHSCNLGLDLDVFRTLDRAMAIRKAEYEYIFPALLGETLRIATWITEFDGKLTMRRNFQIVRLSDNLTLLRGAWTVVCIEMSSGRPKRVPAEFRDGYGAVVVEQSEQ